MSGLPQSTPTAPDKPVRPPLAPPPPEINVLEYHSVLPDAELAASPAWRVDPYIMPASRFQAQMEELHRRGYRAITARELAALLASRRPWPAKTVLITFDDGYEDVQRVAAPIMARYGYRGTVFLIGGVVGTRDLWPPNTHLADPMIDALRVKLLVAAGWDVEAHTFSLHLMPPALFRLVSPPAARQDTAAEDQALRGLTGSLPVAFAYPYGVMPPALVSVVDATYRLAFLGGNRPVTRGDDPHLLPRWTMTPSAPLPWTLR